MSAVMDEVIGVEIPCNLCRHVVTRLNEGIAEDCRVTTCVPYYP